MLFRSGIIPRPREARRGEATARSENLANLRPRSSKLRRGCRNAEVCIAEHDGLDRAVGYPAPHSGMDFLNVVGEGCQGRIVTSCRVIPIVEGFFANTRTDVLLADQHPETDSARRFMKCRFIGQDWAFR